MTDIFVLFIRQMTPVQRRRTRLFLRGWSKSRIARSEKVSEAAIRFSLKAGENRARKRLERLRKDYEPTVIQRAIDDE